MYTLVASASAPKLYYACYVVYAITCDSKWQKDNGRKHMHTMLQYLFHLASATVDYTLASLGHNQIQHWPWAKYIL